MRDRIPLIVISVVLALILVLAIWLLFFQEHSNPTNPFSKLEVTNLKIDTSSDWSKCYVNFTVYNSHNSPIIAIGQIINGINYGYSDITVPAGQTVDESLAVQNLKITNSSSYQIILTFTFDDGNYEDYSQTVYPPQYVAAFSIFMEYFTYKEPNSTEYSVTIKNDGNIPIESANFTISNEDHMVIYQSDSISLGHTMGSLEEELTSQPIPYSSFQSSYIIYITVQVKFADGSTQSTQSSTLPVPTPTPTPTPSSAPTSTPTPTPSPEPTPILSFLLDYNMGSLDISLPVSERASITLTATLTDPTKSGTVIFYYAMPDSGFDYSVNGTMTNGVSTVTIEPWIHGVEEDSGTWRFQAFWEGDSQYTSIYSRHVSIDVGSVGGEP
jgi:hypothetical protein